MQVWKITVLCFISIQCFKCSFLFSIVFCKLLCYFSYRQVLRRRPVILSSLAFSAKFVLIVSVFFTKWSYSLSKFSLCNDPVTSLSLFPSPPPFMRNLGWSDSFLLWLLSLNFQLKKIQYATMQCIMQIFVLYSRHVFVNAAQYIWLGENLANHLK